MSDAIFKGRKANGEKLLAFGFGQNGGAYSFFTTIVGGQFQMAVVVADDGTVKTKVVDFCSGEEYVLHRAAGASGAFVGAVRAEHENVLREISDYCFEPDRFKSEQARQVIQYLRDTHQDNPEFLWPRFPGNAIFRRKDTGKWYAALLVLSRRKLGQDSDEIIEILNLRIEPENLESTLDGHRYFPGYHMNKRHWYTICLDGCVPNEEIFQRIDASYRKTP